MNKVIGIFIVAILFVLFKKSNYIEYGSQHLRLLHNLIIKRT